MMTEFERATKNAAALAQSLGVRIFLYRDLAGRPVFRAIRPAEAGLALELVETFEAPPPTKYEGALPASP